MEFKEKLELLLNNFIITKDKMKEEYYQIKSSIKPLREFTTSKLGCDIIITSSMVKLEKIPALIDNTFRISDFNSIKDYVMYVLIIMFLEDKSSTDQFILSQLVSFIDNNLALIPNKNINIDFKDFGTRKSLVDVLKYMVSLGVIKLIDGNDELFKISQEVEALYENTGISHYIIRQFKEDIFEYKKPIDFLDISNMEDALNKKRFITYRMLLFYPSLEFNEIDNDTYNYFFNYRSRIKNDLDNILDGQLLIYKDVALLTTDEKNGRLTFPNSRKSLHDIILLVNSYVSDMDKLVLNEFELKQLLIKIHNENSRYFSKEYRQMKENIFFLKITSHMESLKLLKRKNDTYTISPVVYLLNGKYESDDNNDENSNLEQLTIDLEV